jgi:hypothetical protein
LIGRHRAHPALKASTENGRTADMSARAVFQKVGRRVLDETDVGEFGAGIQYAQQEFDGEPEFDEQVTPLN